MRFLYIQTQNRPLEAFKIPSTIKFDFKLNPDYNIVYPPLENINFNSILKYEKQYGFEVLLYALTGKEINIEMEIIELNSILLFGDNDILIQKYESVLNELKQNNIIVQFYPIFITNKMEFCKLHFKYEMLTFSKTAKSILNKLK
jgi:hypothetical protein